MMGPIRMLAAIDLRRRWRSTLVLALLVGVVGAVVLASVAGARRTGSSLDRFERETRASNLEINAGEASPEAIDEFRAVNGVAGVGVLRQIAMYQPEANLFLPTAGPTDGSFGRDVDRPRLVEGRLAHAVDELNIGEGLASRLGIGVGDTLTFQSFSPEQVANLSAEPTTFEGPEITFRVVGIVRRPLDLGARGEAGGVVVPTRAFMKRYSDELGSFSGAVLRVRTDHPDDAVPVLAAARRIFGDSPQFQTQGLSIEGQGARSAIDVTKASLWILAGVAALAGAAALALALARHMSVGAEQQPVLRALGLRAPQRWAATASQAVPIAVVGSVLAVALAAAASPLFPLGVARQAEPHLGFRVDAWTLGLGALAVAVAVLAIGGVAAAFGTLPRTQSASRPSLPSEALARAGVPPAVATGVGFALERGRARGGVPVRAAIAGATLGVVGVVAAMTFAANLDRLVTTPSAYGWTWDVAIAGGAFDEANPCGHATEVAGDPSVSAAARLCYGDLVVAGRPVTGYAIDPISGTIAPEIVSGRAPETAREVALGAEALEARSLSLGDDVAIGAGRGSERFRVVGEVVLPGIDDPGPLADMAFFTAGGLDRVHAIDDGYLIISLRDDVDRDTAVKRLESYGDEFGAKFSSVPAEIDRLRQIDFLPTLLATFVAVVALAAVAYASVVAVRRRRRDLAILKTIGFVNRQVRATLAWQATTFGTIGLVIGGVLGLVFGRLVWSRVADNLGVSDVTTVPLVWLLAVVPVVLLVVNLIAAVPARAAARTRPAVVLRSE